MLKWVNACIHSPHVHGKISTLHRPARPHSTMPFSLRFVNFFRVGKDRVKWSRYGPCFSKVSDEKNIQLSTAHRHEVVQVGSESGSAMPYPCYSGVPDLNTLIPLCLRHHYALPACLTINFDREVQNFSPIWKMPAPTPFSQRCFYDAADCKRSLYAFPDLSRSARSEQIGAQIGIVEWGL